MAGQFHGCSGLKNNSKTPSSNGNQACGLPCSQRIGRVITLNDDQALIDYAQPIVNELRANVVRVEADFSATPFKAKISNAEQLRVHTMLVIGGRDMGAGAVSVRLHYGGPQGAKPKADAVADILAAIRERRG